MNISDMDEWKLMRKAVPIIAVILIVILWYKYNEEVWVVRCYEEQANSQIYPETFYVQSEFKEFCLDRGVVIKEIGIDY